MSTASCTTTSKRLVFALMWAAALYAGMLCGTSPAQTQRSAEQRLQDASALASVDAIAAPWHLKMAVTVPDAKSGTSEEGTIERWHAGPESRTIVSIGSSTTTDFDHEGEHFHIQEGAAVPEVLLDLLEAVLHPGADSSQLTGTHPELRTQSFGKATLDCIMLSRPLKPPPGRLPDAVPLGLFPTYCLLPQTDRLRLIYGLGSQTVERTSIGKFQEHEVTTGVLLTDQGTPLARGKVVTLSTYEPTQGDFTPPAGLKPVGAHIPGVASGVIAGAKLGGAIPQFPESARSAHIGGSVVLRAIIGADGHIRRLTVMSAGTPDMAISALKAVRTWTYKPYLLNGEPTAIDTTITVHYDIY